jgi:hypothetical protein
MSNTTPRSGDLRTGGAGAEEVEEDMATADRSGRWLRRGKRRRGRVPPARRRCAGSRRGRNI